MNYLKVLLIACFVCVTFVVADDEVEVLSTSKQDSDLKTSATSAKFFNLGSLFGQYPNYDYGTNWNNRPNTYRPNSYRPNYYPTPTYYPTVNSGSYYPNIGQYPNGQYPNSGQYPSNSFVPSPGYYPNGGFETGAPGVVDYFPNTGTNMLGYRPPPVLRGYGGYGGNGGLNQYSGYWNPEYKGQRNRGYGYFTDTNRYGLPLERVRESNRDLDHVVGGYRGYD